MCGINALTGAHWLDCITAMNDLIYHRGPDEGGQYVNREAGVALAMRRLSIVDLASGQQPMSNEDKTVWIVYNGEIFNAPDFRSRLEGRHHFVTTNSDTEVLVHLYEEKQEAMLNDLNGFFAFIIFDQRRGRLFGARDQTGIKPLYYHQDSAGLACASELKSLLLLPGAKREIDRESLYHYLSLRYVPGEATIFEGIRRLPPGHWFSYDLRTGELTVEQYWSLTFRPDEKPTADEWAERIRYELGEAAKRWTLSDVPIGCSLSGGLDSTSIVALLSQSGFSKLKTYSLGFAASEGAPHNELPLARQVAERWGTDHHECVLEPEALLDALIDMVWHLDEPYGGGLPSWYIFQFMRQDVTVGLTGSGGDELFGNYGKYRLMEARGLQRSRQIYRNALRWHGGRSSKFGNRLQAWVEALDAQRPETFDQPLALYSHLYYTDGEKRRFILAPQMLLGSTSAANTTSTRAWIMQAGSALRTINAAPRDQVMYLDFKTQLPEEFLFMTDRFSMAHSLEARVPFLDQPFIKLVSQIPARIRTRSDDPKYLLRRAVGNLLPPEVTEATKRGFVIPTGAWLRGPLRELVEHLLSPDYLKTQGIFQPGYYHQYVRPHLDHKVERGEHIWAVLMFQLWHTVYIQENATAKPSFRWQDLC